MQSRCGTRKNNRPRLAIVQHGDYREALQIMRNDEPEPYSGMLYSVNEIEKLISGTQYLMVSLNAKKYYKEISEKGAIVGYPEKDLRGRVTAGIRSRIDEQSIVSCVMRFNPTHLLMRTGGRLGIKLARYAAKNNINTLALMANIFRNSSDHRLAIELAQPNVYLVGNHRMPATKSMVAAGVPESKAVAYDWKAAQTHRPEDNSPKELARGPYRVVYAGNMVESKGVKELIEAVGWLNEEGVQISLFAIGDGRRLEYFRAFAAAWNGREMIIELPGRLSNAQVQKAMREATLVCVPSQHSFPEGLPQTMTEGLLSRTPVIASDHPVLKEAFRDGEGVRFFRASDSTDLKRVIRETLNDREKYAKLSKTTADAYERVVCETLMGDLFRKWKEDSFVGVV